MRLAISILIITFLTLLLSSSCNLKKPAVYTLSDNIKTKITKEHRCVIGTHVYMIPPKDFANSKGYPGFENLDKGGIQVFDMVGDNFYGNNNSFSKEKIEKKGGKVEEIKELKINGFDAQYALVQADVPIKRLIFIFGDSTFSVMVLANFDKKDLDLEKQIKKTIETIYYDKKVKINPFSNAPFEIIDNNSRFQFTGFNTNMYSFSIESKQKQNDTNNPNISIMILPRVNETAKSISTSLNQSLERIGYMIDNIIDGKYQDKDGTKVFDTQVYGTFKNEKKLIYRYIIEDKESAIVILGSASKNFEESVKEFSLFASSVKRKIK
jgi:hypothetical protein